MSRRRPPLARRARLPWRARTLTVAPGDAFVHADAGYIQRTRDLGYWNGSRATGVGSGAPLRGRALRYGTAAVLACASVALVVVALAVHRDRATFTPLFGAVAISVWFGGLGPGLLAVAIGWTGALFVALRAPVQLRPRGRGRGRTVGRLARSSRSSSRGSRGSCSAAAPRRTSAAGEADEARERVEQLRATASALSAAATPRRSRGR